MTALSIIALKLPKLPEVILNDLPLQQPPFTVHLEPLCLDDWVKEFQGVIASNRELVHCGNCVRLLTQVTKLVCFLLNLIIVF